MKLIESFMTENPCYTSGKTITVKGLMLHSVGCSQPNAMVFIKQWNSPTYKRACVHGFIDGNTGYVYQTLPWNRRGCHGGGSSNNTHIGVEMCEPSCIKYTKGSSFICTDKEAAQESVKKTYNAAVELFAMLCIKYKLNPLKDIVSHKEGYALGIATNHGDPEHLWKGVGLDYTMDGFRKDVKNKMENEEEEPMTAAEREAFKKLEAKVEKLSTENEILKRAIGWNSEIEDEPALFCYNDENIRNFIAVDGNEVIGRLIEEGRLSVDETGAFAPMCKAAMRLLIIQNRPTA